MIDPPTTTELVVWLRERGIEALEDATQQAEGGDPLASEAYLVDHQKYAAAAARLAELERIVERLPKTADGVVVMAPDKVFTRYGAERFVMGFPDGDVRACENSIEYDPSCPVSDCYSTKEAAEAARAGEARP